MVFVFTKDKILLSNKEHGYLALSSRTTVKQIIKNTHNSLVIIALFIDGTFLGDLFLVTVLFILISIFMLYIMFFYICKKDLQIYAYVYVYDYVFGLKLKLAV